MADQDRGAASGGTSSGAGKRSPTGVTERELRAKAREQGHHDVSRSPEAARRLALLWDPPEPAIRGRKPRFTLAEVVDAGLRVVADGGLSALTMRAVAKELGVGTMSLYTYVPGRAELVDLMIDRVYGELRLPDARAPWRAALTQHAREHHELYLRHPWVLQTNTWRAPFSPNVFDAQEAGLRTLIETGLPEAVVTRTVSLVDAVVQGLARTAVAERQENVETGQDVDEFYEQMSAFWVDYFDPDRYPTITRIYLAGGFDDLDNPFEITIQRLLDTIELSIEQEARRAAPSAGASTTTPVGEDDG